MSKSKQPVRAGTSRPTASQRQQSSERAAAARARIAAAQRKRRMLVVLSSIGTIVVIVAALIVVKVATGAGGPKSGTKATAASSAVLKAVTSVPAATYDKVGAGTARTAPAAFTAPALTKDGKPLVLYVGAEYCPYCAAERWAVTAAMSRFGTWSNVGQTASSPSDVYPSTPTLTYHGASYSSSLLSFTGKEIQSNQAVNGSYAALDKLTSDEQALVKKYDAPPYVQGSSGAIPFVDIGGKYLISGAGYDPGVLQGKTHAQVAAALADPNSKIGQAVVGTANEITAALCALTGDKPSAVCTSQGVRDAASRLTKTG